MGAEGGEAEPELEQTINQDSGHGQSLPASVREPLEGAFGDDFSEVKVHTDSQADRLSRSIGARAFTTGEDIFFSKGEYSPGSSAGREVLAHELTHVVQQRGGSRDSHLQRNVSLNKLGAPGPRGVAGLDADDYGYTETELFKKANVTLTATKVGAVWKAAATSLIGDYTKIIGLLGTTEVTGPAGNSTALNYAKQVQDLASLGAGDDWYMLKAVDDHESVHEAHLLPALTNAEADIQTEFAKLSVPEAGIADAGAAVTAIEALPEYAATLQTALNIWDAEYCTLIDGDHDGPTDAAELGVVNPMIALINQAKVDQNW